MVCKFCIFIRYFRLTQQPCKSSSSILLLFSLTTCNIHVFVFQRIIWRTLKILKWSSKCFMILTLLANMMAFSTRPKLIFECCCLVSCWVFSNFSALMIYTDSIGPALNEITQERVKFEIIFIVIWTTSAKPLHQIRSLLFNNFLSTLLRNDIIACLPLFREPHLDLSDGWHNSTFRACTILGSYYFLV